MDPWAAALDALFNAPGSQRASYVLGNAGLLSDDVRVIRGQGDEAVSFGGSRTIQRPITFDIRKSDVDMPAKGDLVIIDDATFELMGEPMLDVEGLTWTIGAKELKP